MCGVHHWRKVLCGVHHFWKVLCSERLKDWAIAVASFRREGYQAAVLSSRIVAGQNRHDPVSKWLSPLVAHVPSELLCAEYHPGLVARKPWLTTLSMSEKHMSWNRGEWVEICR